MGEHVFRCSPCARSWINTKVGESARITGEGRAGRLPICKPGPELAAPFRRPTRNSNYPFRQGLATGQPASQTRGFLYGLVRKSGLGQFVFDSERPQAVISAARTDFRLAVVVWGWCRCSTRCSASSALDDPPCTKPDFLASGRLCSGARRTDCFTPR